MNESYRVGRLLDHIQSGAVEDKQLLIRIRPILRMFGRKSNHPGFLDAFAIDSIGQYLGPEDPEQHRQQLMSDPNDEDAPTASLSRRTYEPIPIEHMHALSDAEQMLCIPIRGSDEVARKLSCDERVLGSVVVRFRDGARLTLKQQKTNPLSLGLLLESADKSMKGMTAVLDPSQGLALNKLFTVSPAVASAESTDPVTAKHVQHRFGEYHELPVWLTEHMRTLGQDLYRLHALTTAAEAQGSRRQFYLDVAKVRHLRDPKKHKSFRSIVTGTLHKASGGCLCAAHQLPPVKSRTEHRCTDFTIAICGHHFVEHEGKTRCPIHKQCDPLGSTTFPGVCGRDLRVELKCMHHAATVQTATTDNMGLWLSLPTEKWTEALRDFACCACAMSPPEAELSDAQSIEYKASMDAAMAVLETHRATNGHIDTDLISKDAEAVFLLRDASVTYNLREGKMRGKRLTLENREIADSHGHLFKRTKC